MVWVQVVAVMIEEKELTDTRLMVLSILMKGSVAAVE